MPTAIEYALMAGAAYRSTRDEVNRFPIPVSSGWTEVLGSYRISNTSGFEAVAFQRDGEIVISYAGTDPNNSNPITSPDGKTNSALAAGFWADQLLQAAEYYLQIKASLPAGTNITLAGHSLGGGLAALVGVFFGVQAQTFDQAPFAASARSIQNDNATELRSRLMSKLDAGGNPLYDVSALTEYLQLRSAAGGNNFIPRASLVNTVRVEGEFLDGGFLAYNPMGNPAELLTHGPGASSFDLHSQALLTAFLQSNQSVTTRNPQLSLSEVSKKLTELLPMFFDKKLFANDSATDKRNFLDHIVRHEAGIGGAADAMVTRLTVDLWKLAQDGGLTRTDGNPASPQQNFVNKTLMAFAMQMYYEDTANATNASKQLFSEVTGGIQFDITDVSKTFLAALQNGEKLNLVDAKGFDLYFKNYLAQSTFTGSERQLIQTLLPYMRDWYVQAGGSGLANTDILNRGAFMLGGSGIDALVGGTASDLLVGNAGDDVLVGGSGNDVLLGGLGTDTYAFQDGDGLDTILDSDGKGKILYSGDLLTGGAQYGDNRVYRSSDKKHLYVLANDRTLIIDGQVVVEGYNKARSDFDIIFGDAVVLSNPETTREIKGDLKPEDINLSEEGDQYGLDDLGNIRTLATAEADRKDTLFDSAGNDHITSGGGDDTIYAIRGGSDFIEGGTGRDWINAGGGDDVVSSGADGDVSQGGSGDDRLYADDVVTVAQAIVNGNTQTGNDQRGDWLVGNSGDDVVVGSTSNDALFGGGGSDLLIGGAGNDDILGDIDWVANSLDWSALNNVFTGSGNAHPEDFGSDVIYAGAGNDDVWAGRGNDVLYGEGGDDYLAGNGDNDILFGGAGDDTLKGDWIYLVGTTESHMGDDYLDGGTGDDYLDGGAGNDILIGGAGFDYLAGGSGQDTYIFNKGDGIDTVSDTNSENNIFRFGAGFTQSDVTLRLGSLLLDLGGGDQIHIENFNSDDVYNSVVIDSFQFDDGTSLTSSELLARGFDLGGTEQQDILSGTNIADRISGFGGDDLLVGRAGDDSVKGGDGDDELFGDDMVTLLDGALHGSDFIDGEGGNDKILGNGGADTLHGGLGNDEIWGDGGWPTSDANYLGSQYHGNDYINAGEGNDYVQGDGGDDTIYGGSGADILWGDADEAFLSGEFHGADYLDGGDGNDALYGGNGNDTLIGGAGSDLLDGGAGDDDFDAGAGDRVVGGGGSNNLILADGEPITASSAGADLLINYGTGSLVVEDGLRGSMATIDGHSAFDWVQTHVTHSLTIATSQAGQTLLGGSGNDVLNALHGDTTLMGGAGNDILIGSDGEDVLVGGSGTNNLQGGAGDDVLISSGELDTLEGGEGDNVYRITNDANNVRIVTRLGSDNDTVALSGSPETTIVKTSRTDEDLILSIFIAGTDGSVNQTQLAGPVITLAGYFYHYGDDPNTFKGVSFEGGEYVTVEQLLLIAATGTDGDDDLYGSSGADILASLDGNDRLYGFDGNDQLDGGAGNDLLEGANGADTLYGGSGDDQLAGGYGNDTLHGGEGADELLGGEGNDMLNAGAGNDVLHGGLGNDHLAGGAGDDSLNGGDGVDTMDGGDGNDILVAGKGNDVLTGGAGMDTYVLGYGMNRVTIVDDSQEGSVIQLDESGLDLQDLAAKRSSNDLLIEVRGTDSSFRIKDYYSGAQTSWTLRDAAGNSVSARALIDASTPQWGSLQASLLQEFKATARGAIEEKYAAQGYVRQADGSWFQPNGFAEYGPATFSNENYQTLFEYSYTHRLIEDLTETWETTDSVSISSYWSKNSWTANAVRATDTLVTFTDQASTASGAYVELDSLTSATSTSTAWSAVTGWNAYYNYSYAYSWSYPSSYVTATEIITQRVRTVETRRFYTGSGAPLTFDAPAAAALAGPLPAYIAVGLTHNHLTYNLGQTVLADGDHTVIADAYSAVIGGSGSNFIYNAGFAYGGTGNGVLVGGGILMAGTGNQHLEDGRVMVVGDGHTTVVGRASGHAYYENGYRIYDQVDTTILIDPNNTGVDLLVSDSMLWSDRDGASGEDAIEAVYSSRGVVDPHESYRHGGLYRLYLPEQLMGYFESREAAFDVYSQVRYPGQEFDGALRYIEPLSEVLMTLEGGYGVDSWGDPSVYYETHPISTVVLTANNFDLLQPYQDAGLMPEKTVRFGTGLDLQDIGLSWGSAVSPSDGSTHVTLNLSWGEDQGVQVMMPYFNDAIGGAVSRFEFSDGTSISLRDLIALAPPAPNLDPGVLDFYEGAGLQSVAAGTVQGINIGALTASDILVSSDGADLIVSLQNGQDSLRLVDWYSERDNFDDISLLSDDGSTITSSELTERGLLKDGSGGNLTLYGVPDFGTTFIAGPNTVLIGMSDEDTYIYAPGSGVVHIQDSGNGTLRLAEGIGSDTYKLEMLSGELVLSFGGLGDAIYFDGFDPDAVEDFASVQIIEFADGTELYLEDLLEWGFDIQGSAADDTLVGTGANENFYGGAGNDTMVGGAGNDSYQVGEVGDVVVELADEGDDWIESSVTYTTPEHVEGLLLLGDDSINGTGNEFDNGLIGNSGINVLRGESGNDYMEGGAGDDTLIGGAGDDAYAYFIGSGHDVVIDSDDTEGNVDYFTFYSGISASDTAVYRHGQDLVLSYGATDSVTVKDWFVSSDHQIEQVIFNDAEGTVWDAAQLEAMAAASLGFINGTQGDDYLDGTDNADTIHGRWGNDMLYGHDGDDTLFGGGGDDWIYAGSGDDTIDGGTGYDNLWGGTGNDLYLYKRGDGSKAIQEEGGGAGNVDTLRFDDSVSASDVEVHSDGYSLYLRIAGTTDSVYLSQWFVGDSNKVERVEFSDGTVWTASDLLTQVIETQGDDNLTGTDGEDVLRGLGGNDILNGGAGDDQLQGGAGNDVYLFKGGDGFDSIASYGGGTDVIRFDSSVVPADVTVSRSASGLFLHLNGGLDRIGMGWFSGSDQITRIEFSDGTVWNGAMLESLITVAPSTARGDILYGTVASEVLNGLGGNDEIHGNDGNDVLYGGSGDDYLDGGAGNDTLDGGTGSDALRGGIGNDVYLFGRGSGQKEVNDYDGALGNMDTLRFDSTVSTSDIRVTRDSAHLFLNIAGTEDRVTLSYWFYDDAQRVEQFEFADGTVWNAATLEGMIVVATGTEGDDNLYGTEGNDELAALGGDDYIAGLDGDDILDGGAGADGLEGGAGNDLLYGRAGEDELYGVDGDDTLDGGLGDDYLHGGSGNDVYLFSRGSGQDSISDYDETAGNIDTIRFDNTVSSTDIEVTQDGENLYLSIVGTEDRIAIAGWNLDDAQKIERVEFADGTIWDAAYLANPANHAPVAANGIADQNASEDTAWSFTVPADSFSDPDSGDSLNYSATLASGAALPGWLSFDAASRTFSGVPGNSQVGSLNLKVTATDGASASVSSTFSLTVANVNDAPTVVSVIADHAVAEDTVWNYTVPSDAFADADAGDILSYQASLDNGDPLPGWLVFDAATRTFSGTPTNGDAGSLSLRVTATDAAGASVSSSFDVTITHVNDAPIGISLSANTVVENAANAVVGSFSTSDPDAGDTFTYSIVPGGDGAQFAIVGSTLTVGAAGLDYEAGGTRSFTVRSTDQDGLSHDELVTVAVLNDGNDDLNPINGTSGNDWLGGGSGNDLISGGDGNDTISSSDGDDILDGGAGNDSMMGSAGNDTYIFGRGYGQDNITNGDAAVGKLDVIQLKPDVLVSEVQLRRTFDNLILSIADTTDSLTVYNFFSANQGESAKIAELRFADGTVWDYSALWAGVLIGDTADNNISAYATSDVLDGRGGNDFLSGGAGNDTLHGGTGNDFLWGDGDDDVLFGDDGVDNLNAGSGSDVLNGGNGDDGLIGEDGNDTMYGEDGNDFLNGGAGDDVLDGGSGNDQLMGGSGNDTYLFGRGYGQDVIINSDAAIGKVDVIQLTADVLPDDVTLAKNPGGWNLVLSIKGTSDSITVNTFFHPSYPDARIDRIAFADGTIWDSAAIRTILLTGDESPNSIQGFDGESTIDGKGGNDTLMSGGDWSSLIFGRAGDDTLFGGAGNDVHNGGADNDAFYSGAGNDVLVGGLGNDALNAADGNDLLIGGAGHDTISTGGGADVIAFNEGDGQDTVLASTSKDNTLSLGQGIEYSELSLSKFGYDLVLDTGSGDKLTFKDWYANPSNRSVANLQMVIDGGADYDSSSQSDLHNKKIVQFDFDGLVNSFDQALSQNPGLTSWALSSALTSFHLGSSDTAAIGGDLSFEYGKNNTLSGISIDPARAILANTQFGSASQGLQPANNLQDSTLRIM